MLIVHILLILAFGGASSKPTTRFARIDTARVDHGAHNDDACKTPIGRLQKFRSSIGAYEKIRDILDHKLNADLAHGPGTSLGSRLDGNRNSEALDQNDTMTPLETQLENQAARAPMSYSTSSAAGAQAASAPTSSSSNQAAGAVSPVILNVLELQAGTAAELPPKTLCSHPMPRQCTDVKLSVLRRECHRLSRPQNRAKTGGAVSIWQKPATRRQPPSTPGEQHKFPSNPGE